MTNDSKNNQISEAIIQIIKEKKPQTVEQLVALVKEKHQIPDQNIVESILKLQKMGKLGFIKQPSLASPNLTTYLKTEQALWYWATIATSIITTAIVFTIPEDFYPWAYIRHVLGAIFVLWLPGYTFIKALFPTESPLKTLEKNKSLDAIERIALSLGMSLALVPIVGLLLNYTPWGIRLTPIVLSLLTCTVIFATAAIIREHRTKIKLYKENLQVE